MARICLQIDFQYCRIPLDKKDLDRKEIISAHQFVVGALEKSNYCRISTLAN